MLTLLLGFLCTCSTDLKISHQLKLMASSSSSFSNQVMTYDVFLSFRGQDTRYNFTSHLYKAFRRENIKTFVDGKLNGGEPIWSSLTEAIKESFISVVIFSERYASSRWCLQELVEILTCRRKNSQVVIPVFYNVDPSDVRNLRGRFAEGFRQLEERFSESEEMLQNWRNALNEAANLSGFDSNVIRMESVLVEEIVEKILKRLNRMPSNDSNHLVGAESSISKIISLLRIGSKDVCAIGIWGMGGIGKTAIAKAVFNEIWSHFEESFFAENVRGESKPPNGLTRFQEGLLSKNSNTSFAIAKLRFNRMKVLIVLDDVTSADQNIYKNLNFLGEGSCVIITARDKQVLQNYEVHDDNIYKVEGLFYSEAFQLFGRHAFPQGYPISLAYYQLSDKVLEYAKGVPLALKELGRTLSNKEKNIWESVINKLQKIPNQTVQLVLEVSYKELDEFQQKSFLDVACFFKWENIDLVKIILKAKGCEPDCDLDTLADKCLISKSNNKITMHDLLQEMAWQIVRKGRSPENRNHLWYHEDIHHVLERGKGTEAIEGICLDMSIAEDIFLNPDAFTRMQNLKILKVFNSRHEENNINKVHVSNINSDFEELRYLCWYGCPLESLENFHLCKNLAVLDMRYSTVEQLWTGIEHLVNLRHINLSYSQQLTSIQDLSWAPNLENLILEGCSSLRCISSSIEHLDKLVILNLRECKELRSLPTSIRSNSLRKVIFSGCSKLERLPEMSSNVAELSLDGTSIEELTPSMFGILSKKMMLNLKNCSRLKVLPSDIRMWNSLEHLDLSDCSKLDGLPDNLGNFVALKVLKAERATKRALPSSIVNLSCLMELHLTDCSIKELPNNLGQLSSLESLLLGGNNFESLPTSIKDLSKLCYLDLGYCTNLQSLPEFPSNLQYIDAHSCGSLKSLSDLSFLFSPTISRKGRINFINCFHVDQNALEASVKDTLLRIQRRQDYKEFYQRPSACICYPGTEIAEWFTYNTPGSSITLDLNPGWFNSSFLTFAMCAIVEFGDYSDDEGQGLVVSCDCKLKSEDDKLLPYHGTLRGSYFYTKLGSVKKEHVFLGYDFNMCSYDKDKYSDFLCSNQMTIEFYVNNLNAELIDCCKVIKCGVHLLYCRETRIPRIPTIEEEDESELGILKEYFPSGKQLKGESSESTVSSSKYVNRRRKKGIYQFKSLISCFKVNPAPELNHACQKP